MLEKTLILLKPDCIARGLIGDVTSRFEKSGLKIVAMKMQWVKKDFAEKHYTEDIAKRRGEDVRNWLLNFITEGPVVAIVLEGVNAIDNVRKLVGDTEPLKAIPGTIRGDLAHTSYEHVNEKQMAVRNLIHASADKNDAESEINLWFTLEEMHDYHHSQDDYTK